MLRGEHVLLLHRGSLDTKLAEEDVNSSRDFEDGTAAASAAVFGGNFGARKEELAAADAAATLLFEAPLELQSGKRN